MIMWPRDLHRSMYSTLELGIHASGELAYVLLDHIIGGVVEKRGAYTGSVNSKFNISIYCNQLSHP